jgi:hypothetical protein
VINIKSETFSIVHTLYNCILQYMLLTFVLQLCRKAALDAVPTDAGLLVVIFDPEDAVPSYTEPVP